MRVTTRPKRVTYVLIESHVEAERLFQLLERPTTGSRRAEVLAMVIAQLSRHALAKKAYVYPAVRAVLLDGEQVCRASAGPRRPGRGDHGRLERISPEDPSGYQDVSALISLVRHQVIDEEQELFPRMIAAFTPAQLADLGDNVAQAMRGTSAR